MTNPAILEAATQALQDFPHEHIIVDNYSYMAEALIAAVTPLILANERKEIAEQARRYAGHYPEGSDGRNTFIMLAEWIEARP